MARELKIIIKADSTQAEAAVRRISAEIARMNKPAPQMPAGFDAERLSEYRKISEQLRKIDLENYKSQQRQAETAAKAKAQTDTEALRRATEIKKSELRQFESAEKSKQRIAEISAKGQIQEAAQAAKAAENLKRREFQTFERIEKDKARLAAKQNQSSGVGASFAGNFIASSAIKGISLLSGQLTDLITAGIEYEKSLNTFQAVTKATGDQMKLVATRAKELGAATDLPATSAKDAALAMTELAKAGLDVNQSLSAARGVLQLAAAGQLDEAKAAEIAANALNAFKLEAIQTVRVADLLAAASNASSAEVGDIAAAMQQAAAGFAAAKVPIEDLTTAISIMANAGIKGSDAGTSLKTLLSSLQAPRSNDAAAAIKELITSAYQLDGTLKPLPQLVAEFEQSLAGLNDEARAQAINTIFGSDASRAAEILFSTGVAGFNKIKEAVTQTGAAADLAAAKTKGLGGAWENFKSTVETIQINLFEKIAPSAESITKQAAEYVGKFAEAVESEAAKGGAKAAGMKIGEYVGYGIGAGAAKVIPDVADFITKTISEALSGKSSAPIGMWGTVAVGKGILQGLGIDSIESAVAKIKGLLTGLLDFSAGIFFRLGGFFVHFGATVTIEIGKIATWLPRKLGEVGANAVQGFINGMQSKEGLVGSTAKSIMGLLPVGIVMNALAEKSPSKVFHEIGSNVTQGYVNGMDSGIEKIKTSSRKMAIETINSFKEAIKEFNKLAGISSQEVGVKLQTDEYSQGASDLQEIIKLRGKTATNLDQALPTTLAGTTAELARLKEILKQTEDRQTAFEKNLDSLKNVSDEMTESIRKNAEEFEKRKQAIEESGAENVLNLSKDIDLLGVTSDIEKQRIENLYKIKELRADMAKDGFSETQIREAENLQRIENARTLELVKLREDKQAQIDAAKELADAQKKAAEDAAQAMREAWENTRDFVRESLDIMTDDTLSFGEKVKSFFGNIGDRLKENFLDKLSAGITTQILGFDPNEKNPVVGAVSKSNDYLKRIADAIAPTTPLNTISSGGILGGAASGNLFAKVLPSIFGGGLNNRNGINSSMIMNMAGGEFSNLSLIPDLLGGMSSGVGNGRESGGGIFSNLKNLFSTKDGGLFAKRQNILTGKDSRMGGILGGIGDLASMFGGMIGGRTGGVISMAGTGASLGSMFGPWGAGIGAAVGGLVGLLTNSQRKNDEVTRTEYKNQALAALDSLISQLGNKPSSIQPPSAAATQADQILSQYQAAVSTLKDKKTRNIALNELKSTEALGYRRKSVDTAIQAALQWQADEANRKKISSEFTGQFAGGTYFNSFEYGDFKRRNGMLAGTFTGKDHLPALLADGEMVLNPSQINRIRAAAGFDAFAYGQIPNYPKTPVPKFAEGVSFASTPVNSNVSNRNEPTVVNLELRFDGLTGKIKAVVKSPDVQRFTIGNVKTYFDEGQLPE